MYCIRSSRSFSQELKLPLAGACLSGGSTALFSQERADPRTPLFLCARPNVCVEQELAIVGHRQPCVQAFTRTLKVWKQDCGGRRWCTGYERRYVFFLQAWFAPCVMKTRSFSPAAARKGACRSPCVPAKGRARGAGSGCAAGGVRAREVRAGKSRACARPAARAAVGHGRQPR